MRKIHTGQDVGYTCWMSTDGTFTFEERTSHGSKRRGLKEYREKAQIIFQDPYSSLDPG